MNAGVGPVGLPAIEICLRCLQTLEALSFKWCLLRMAHPGFNFAFAIWIFHPTGQSDCAIVGKQMLAAILSALRIAHPWSSAVIHLCFFTRRGDDHGASGLQLWRTEFVNEAFDALIAVRETVIGDQVLVDGGGIPA